MTDFPFNLNRPAVCVRSNLIKKPPVRGGENRREAAEEIGYLFSRRENQV